MPRKLPYTPLSRIKNAIRQVWLRSRERAAAIKREANTCQCCKRKGSQAKGREVAIQVHHIHGIDWDGICQDIRKRVLQTPDAYEVLCKDCHAARHGKPVPVTESKA